MVLVPKKQISGLEALQEVDESLSTNDCSESNNSSAQLHTCQPEAAAQDKNSFRAKPRNASEHYPDCGVDVDIVPADRASTSSAAKHANHSRPSYAQSKSTSELDLLATLESQDPYGWTVKNERLQSSKSLSVSSPAIYPSPMRPCIEDSNKIVTPHFSHARNKRFHKIFTSVSEEDKVLDYYSCAFISDILLQGYLYITEQYFGFYSNVFGHKTKILIPVTNITLITKERTAKIFPNAVGVTTKEGPKYCFGSLLSRYTTYRFMIQVWKKRMQQELKAGLDIQITNGLEDKPINDGIESDARASWSSCEDPCETLTTSSSLEDHQVALHQSQSMSSNQSKTSTSPLGLGEIQEHDEESDKNDMFFANQVVPKDKHNKKCNSQLNDPHTVSIHYMKRYLASVASLPWTSVFLLICTVLLMVLYMSSVFLVYRRTPVHNQYVHDKSFNYKEMFNANNQMQSASVKQLQELLAGHIQQITAIKKSLEALKLVSSTKRTDSLHEKRNNHER